MGSESSAMALHLDDQRRRLPNDRAGRSHSFEIAGHHVVIRTGEYPDGTLGEVFLDVDKSGSTMSGILDGFATVVSIALQYEVPLEVIAAKFVGSRFEPSGFTGNPEIEFATSILDYVFRYLTSRYSMRDAA